MHNKQATRDWSPSDLDESPALRFRDMDEPTDDDLDLDASDIDLSDDPFPPEPELPAPVAPAIDIDEEDTADPHAASIFPVAGQGPEFPAAFVGGADQPVPRITIQAFCDRSDTAKRIQSIALDRRLAKATTTVETGGFDCAIASLRHQASPNLLILDLAAPPADILAGLDRVAEFVDQGTKAIVIGGANDVQFYRELVRRGVSEYLVAPVSAAQLIQSITRLFADPDKPFAGRVSAFIGARGGVGASSIAHNVAWCLAERFSANTTLVDLDIPFGTAGLNFEEETELGVGDALQRIDQIDEVFLDRLLTRKSEHFALFPAAASLHQDGEPPAEAFESLVSLVRRTSPFVVLDMPHAWTRWTRSTLLSADDVLVVTTPDLAGLRNAKGVYDFARAARPHDPPPAIILNMIGTPKRPEIPLRDFAKALGAEPLALVPFDPYTFGTAANNAQMVCEMAADSKPAMAIESLARAICGREARPKRKVGLLDRLQPILKR